MSGPLRAICTQRGSREELVSHNFTGVLGPLEELLDNKGGFEAFGCYLAEDFFFAQAVQVGS